MESAAEINGVLRSLHHLDKDVTLAINGCHTPFTDSMWQVFSDHRIWIVLYLAIAALVIVRLGWKRGLLLIVCCILCVTCIDQLDNLVKESIQRLRPVHDADMLARGLHVLEVPGRPYGFFSAHAGNAASFVTCTLMGLALDKKHNYTFIGILLSVWVLLVGVSRVFVGKHFLGDVLTGFAAGVLFGLLVGLLFRLVCKKVGFFNKA